jgi:hypothetical protein
MFQPKAWVDQNFANEWVLKSASKYMTTQKKHLLFMDNLHAQTTSTFKKVKGRHLVLFCIVTVSLICIA